jgi:hypothetical protein
MNLVSAAPFFRELTVVSKLNVLGVACWRTPTLPKS